MVDDIGLLDEMRLPPPEPYYSAPNFPIGLQNTATIFREAANTKTLADLEKDLDSLLLLGKGEVTDSQEALTSNLINPESGEGDQIPHDSILTIRSTPQGRTVYWRNTHDQTLPEANIKAFD